MLEAYRIRKLNRLPALDTSYRNLGRLRLAQGDLRAASALLDLAVARSHDPHGLMPTWDIFHARAQVHLAQGHLPEAVEDLRVAARLAHTWQRSVSPADVTRLASEQLVAQAYAGLAEAATSLYFLTGKSELAREGFEAAEANRAASLQAWLAQGPRQGRLPAQYWELLSRLEVAEVRLLRRQPGAADEIEGLRAALVDVEVRAGMPAPPPDSRLLPRLQHNLPPDTAYFAFVLAEPASFLWALDRGSLKVRRLPGKAALSASVRAFCEAVRTGKPEATSLGAELYAALFGSVPARFVSRSRWLVAPDDELFTLPFAALRNGREFLVERHATQVVTGAALVGSAREITLCAAAWRDPRPTLLVGESAAKASLQVALQARPAVLHVATHVLESAQRSRHGLIVLSLKPGGEAEILDPVEIAAWYAPLGLVVMSGCSSGSAEAPRGSGLMGLTRAWLAGGAAAVAATRWSTPDDAGWLLGSMYGHLRNRPAAGPAVALQQAQIDTLRAGGWRSRPAYWSGYFVVGNR
jgi:hypothetical protein